MEMISLEQLQATQGPIQALFSVYPGKIIPMFIWCLCIGYGYEYLCNACLHQLGGKKFEKLATAVNRRCCEELSILRHQTAAT